MQIALKEAKKAYKLGEVPVGAVLVSQEGQLLAKAHNLKESLQTSIAHAEILCIHRASKKIKNWRLNASTLYVTLEPCAMCAGALVLARVKRLVFGCLDTKTGASKSLYKITEDPRLNHQIEVTTGVLEAESSLLLKSFFQQLRQNKK